MRVAFLVNGGPGSAMDIRARGLSQALAGKVEACIVHRGAAKARAIPAMASAAVRFRPDVLYVLDAAYSGVAAATAASAWCRRPWVLDTGDAILALARSSGERGRIGVWLTGLLEQFSQRAARRVVVRGSYHAEVLAAAGIRAEVIPDGVQVEQFAPRPVPALRRQLGLEGSLVVGVLGSSVWNERLQLCYGWELIELLRELRDPPVMGVLIGSGSGIPVLERRARDYGVAERMRFVGHVAYERLPDYLCALDVCLSTQTADLVGQVRTTGKLPLYMAAGRYVLASRVGEAARILPEEMLVPYQGTVDREYPRRLRERIAAILTQPDLLQRGEANLQLARRHFDYSVLGARLLGVLQEVTR